MFAAEIAAYSLPLTGVLPGCPDGQRRGFLLRLSDQHSSALGECAPLPGFSRETLEQASEALQACTAKLCADPERLADVYQHGVDATLGNYPSSVVNAVEFAVAGLIQPAGQLDNTAPECVLLTGSAEQIIARASALSARQVRIKLKVGRHTTDRDIALIDRLDRILPEPVKLRLDSNRSWNLADAVAFASRVPSGRVDFFEEPLKDSDQLPAFCQQSDMPVALDESLQGQAALPQLFPGLAAFVVKPMVAGGLYRCRQLAALAQANNLGLVISSSYESPAGIHQLRQLACELAPRTAPGLDTLSIFPSSMPSWAELETCWSYTDG